MEEIEVKFLNIEADLIESKLRLLRAKKIYDRIFRDRVFDFPGWPLDKKFSWVRLRDKGDAVTLSFKKRMGVIKGRNDRGMKETEVSVGDFERTSEILESLGMIQKFNEEKRRIHYKLKGADIDLDTVPLIPTYLEIEGNSWAQVERLAMMLGLKWKDRKKMSTMQVYGLYGINEKDYSVLTFNKQIKKKT